MDNIAHRARPTSLRPLDAELNENVIAQIDHEDKLALARDLQKQLARLVPEPKPLSADACNVGLALLGLGVAGVLYVLFTCLALVWAIGIVSGACLLSGLACMDHYSFLRKEEKAKAENDERERQAKESAEAKKAWHQDVVRNREYMVQYRAQVQKECDAKLEEERRKLAAWVSNQLQAPKILAAQPEVSVDYDELKRSVYERVYAFNPTDERLAHLDKVREDLNQYMLDTPKPSAEGLWLKCRDFLAACPLEHRAKNLKYCQEVYKYPGV